MKDSTPTPTPADAAWAAVWASIRVAVDVTVERQRNPEAFPLVESRGDAVIDEMTRKALAHLMELGFQPDGWEQAYFGRAR